MKDTQIRLLDTAADLFASRGYAGVSMRSIAQAVGITQAAIYHHFDSKDALYVATITYLFEQSTLGISERMAAVDAPAKRLELLIGTMLVALDSDPRFLRIYLRELLEGNEQNLAAIAESAFIAFYEPLYALMGELAPGTDAQLLIFSMAGMIFHQLDARKLGTHLPHHSTKDTDIPALTKHITKLFLYGALEP